MRIIPILGSRRIFRLVHNNLNSSIFYDNRALRHIFYFSSFSSMNLELTIQLFSVHLFRYFFLSFFSFSVSLLARLPYVIILFWLNVFFMCKRYLLI